MPISLAAIINYGEKLAEIFKKYPSDFGLSDNIDLGVSPVAKIGEWKDEWGSVWVNLPGF